MNDKVAVQKTSSVNPNREILIGGGTMFLFFVVLGGWAALARLDAAVHASGTITVSGHRQAVQHLDGGTVSKIFVHEGDMVHQNDVLIELQGQEVKAREQSLFSQVATLEAVRARLMAEYAGQSMIPQPTWFIGLPKERATEAQTLLDSQASEMKARGAALISQLNILRQRQGQLADELEGYQRQKDAQDEQAKLVNEELTGVRELRNKGLAPVTRVLALERALADLKGNAGQYDSQRARAQQAIGETKVQVLLVQQQRTTDIAEELRQTEAKLAELHPQLQAATEQLERLRIRAPASGVVLGLNVFTPGGVISGGQKLMEIVPQDRDLVIQANLRPQDADDLSPGQQTEIRILAFNQRDMPILEGVVNRISADQFVDERSGEAFFRAELTVPAATIETLERRHNQLLLRPGLPVEVIVPLRKRSALSYFLEPLNTVLWRSFREH